MQSATAAYSCRPVAFAFLSAVALHLIAAAFILATGPLSLTCCPQVQMMKSLLFSAHPTSLLLPAPRLRRLLRLRAASSASASAPPRADRRSPGTPSRRPSSSLYARPSLLDMERDRATRRADVDAFLTSLGVDPGELAGLELPVTVDVMRERAEFLGSLGLTQEDLAAYPLALGCSVRKNIVAVLDFLGKLGICHDAHGKGSGLIG